MPFGNILKAEGIDNNEIGAYKPYKTLLNFLLLSIILLTSIHSTRVCIEILHHIHVDKRPKLKSDCEPQNTASISIVTIHKLLESMKVTFCAIFSW